MAALQPGTRLGPFEIVALLGMGGMGEVYRARDTRLKREVALKILPDTWVKDADRLARFQREAELLATLNHQNIAAIYGLEESDGRSSLVLELVEGQTLADRLAAGALPMTEALEVARQITEALDAAHERGIVHRDLKPANIKIRPDGTIKVLDFGLAKALDPHASADRITSQSPTVTSPAVTGSGVILGTAAYMSPEQARGQAIDKRTDIWAFGCVLYEMLTGRRTFDGETVTDTLVAILERQPDWSALPARTPARVRRLLERCLEKDRKRRLRDIGDAREGLDDRAAEGDLASASEFGRPMRWAYLAVGTVALAAVLAMVMTSLRSDADLASGPTSLGPSFRPLTRDDSFSIEPALSRNGEFVVYASDRAGDNLDLWLQRTAGGPPLPRTSDPSDDREPDFSPDGDWIVFRSDRDGGGVYRMPTLAGDATLLAPNGRSPRYSPDGTRVAYWVGPWLGNPRMGSSRVHVVPVISGTPTEIDGFRVARNPVWSPDGRQLLFFGQTDTSDAFDWWLVPADGGPPRATGVFRLLDEKGLLDEDEGDVTWPTAWTERGILFSARLGQSINIWRVAIDTQSGQVIGSSLARLTVGVGTDLEASTDGAGRVAFQVRQLGTVSLTLPLEPDSGQVTGSILKHTYQAGLIAGGRNSMDHAGRMLTYPRRSANGSEVWVKDLKTGRDSYVVTTPLTQVNPVISPDGTKIAYSGEEEKGRIGYIVPTSGGTPSIVCDQCNLLGWFADNRRILATNQQPATGVSVVDVVDLTRRDLISSERIGRADVSPNGRWLSFLSGGIFVAPLRPDRPPERDEWVMVLPVEQGSGERACGWSPDSSLLYLLLERDGFRDLYAQRIDPSGGAPVGEPFLVWHFHDPRRRWGSTPFGNAIVSNAFVFHQEEMTGSIWLLDPGK